MGKRLRVAQIGLAHDHATQILATVQRLKNDFEIVAAHLPEDEVAKYPKRVAKFEGIPLVSLDALWKMDLDAVFIETQEDTLSKYAIMAAEHGVPIHLDKPGGFVYADFKKLISLVKEKNLVFQLGYMYRYNPAVIDLMKSVDAGEFGEIPSIDAEMSSWHEPEKRVWMNYMPDGIMFFLGCHLIDIAVRIKGEPVEVIPLTQTATVDGVPARDLGYAVLKYPDGLATIRTMGYERGGFERRYVCVAGAKKTVEIRPIEHHRPGGMEALTLTAYGEDVKDRGTTLCQPYFGRYTVMIESFAREVRGEIQNPYTPDYELMLYRTVLRASGVEVPEA